MNARLVALLLSALVCTACDEPLPDPLTCAEQGGLRCAAGQTCRGAWLATSDGPNCCSASCRTEDPCGDGVCDAAGGESPGSCATDCPLSADCDHLGIGLPYGEMDALAGAAHEITVVAPHGTFDYRTRELAGEIAAHTGANYVRAWDYRTSDHYINVNRPTETTADTWSARAQGVYDTFRTCVEQLTTSRYYIEVHGNSRAESALVIEVATVGVDGALAAEIKAAWNQIRSGTLAGYDILVEPVDAVYFGASGNKASGMLSHCAPEICLHVELPRALREDQNRAETASALGDLIDAFAR